MNLPLLYIGVGFCIVVVMYDYLEETESGRQRALCVLLIVLLWPYLLFIIIRNAARKILNAVRGRGR